MKYFTSAILITGLLLTILCTNVKAQAVGLSVSPSKSRLIAKPGTDIQLEYQVENTGDPTTIEATINSIQVTDTYGHIVLKNTLEDALQFTLNPADGSFHTPVLLKNHDSKKFHLTLHIPETTPEADYYYAFVTSTLPSPATEGQSLASIKTQTVSPIIISITTNGSLEAKGAVSLFKLLHLTPLPFLPENVYDSFDTIPLVMVVKNTGKNAIQPKGDIKVIENGHTVSTLGLDSQLIAAHASRIVYTATPCTSVICQQVTTQLHGFFLGTVHVQAQLQIDNQTSLYTTTSFTAVPFKLVSIICIIGLLTGAVFIFIKNRS